MQCLDARHLRTTAEEVKKRNIMETESVRLFAVAGLRLVESVPRVLQEVDASGNFLTIVINVAICK